MSDRSTPQAWHAQVLHDEAEQLAIACRMLEFQQGYWAGVAEAQVAA